MTTIQRSALVAVHDSDVRLAIRWQLDREGFVVRTATHFAAAREMAPGDLLVVDLDLSHRTAFDLLHDYQQRGLRPWTLIVGSEVDDDDLRRAMALGVRGFLRVPHDEAELQRALSELRADWQSARGYVRAYESSRWTTERAPRDLAAYALRSGIGPACRARIASACADLLENVERHAYPDSSGPVLVQASFDGRELDVVVSDEGIGFDPVLVSTGSMARSLDGGLARCTALSESLQVESRLGEGTTIRIGFASSQVQFDDGRSIDLSDLDFLAPDTARQVLETLQHRHAADVFHLSPALAVIVGRLLVGPDPRRALQMAIWS